LPGARSIAIQFNDYGLDLRWTPEIPLGTRLILSLGLEGEPLEIAQESWCDESGKLKLKQDFLEGEAGIFAATVRSIHELEALPLTMFLASCEAVVDSLDEQVRKYGCFFCELDLHTNWKLIDLTDVPEEEATERIAIIKRMERLLFRRVMRRRKWVAERNRGPAEDLPSSPKGHVEYISRVLLEIYRRHLFTEGVKEYVDQVWQAFGMFANGELRVPFTKRFPWNGEPDSAQVFCFAEFAIMAIDSGVDVYEWSTILPSHVAMQKIFMRAYYPTGKPLRFESYKPVNWSEDKQFKDPEKAQLREDFEDKKLEQLKVDAGEHARDAFRDE
jgi:hypothetical protein